MVMKARYFNIGVLMALVATLFPACDSDRDDNPTLGPNHNASTFVVNEPALADQYIQLSPENTVNLTWTQPDYGVNTVVNYKVQVGLMENGSVKWADGYLDTGFTSCNVNVSGEEIAKAICKLDGFATEDDYVDKGFREVAMRVAASIKTTSSNVVEGTEILSNIVTFKHMAAYNAIKSPGFIYIVGNCTDWQTPNAGNTEHYSAWRLFEKDDAIGSKVYYGTFELPAGAQFRFYRALTGWDQDSMGPQVDDAGVESAFTNGEFEGAIQTNKAKGTWLFSGFEGGTVEMMVDLNQNKVKFTVK